MRLVHTMAAAGLFVILSSARADSSIHSNYVDHFGSLTPSTTSHRVTAAAPGRASAIRSNYVDDFGPLTPSATTHRATAVAPDHASAIRSNYVDDFGLTPAKAHGNAVTAVPEALIPHH